MRPSTPRVRRVRNLLLAAVGLALALGVSGVVLRKAQEPERVHGELEVVEDLFGPIPEDAKECVLRLEIHFDGSNGYLDILTPTASDRRTASWHRKRPPEALCNMRSMNWEWGGFLGEFGNARWTEEQLGFRQDLAR